MLLRLKVWKDWNKKCINSKLYKFLVLLGVRRSPTFYCNYMVAKHKVEHDESLSDILQSRIIAIEDVRKMCDGLDEFLKKMED